MAMTLDNLVSAVRGACDTDLIGVVLYGSAAGRDYHGSASDQNVLMLVRDAGIGRLRTLAPCVRQWIGAGNPPPLLLTLGEWQGRSDVFAIEYSDLLERHRVLFGALPMEGVSVRRRDLRLQLESESMGKLLRFRRGVMTTAGDAERARGLLDESFSSILALLRGTLHLHGEVPPDSSEALCDRVAALAGFDSAPFRAVLNSRRSGTRLRDDAVDGVVGGYLEALERLVAHVDTIAAD
jgi:hypothetical protein